MKRFALFALLSFFVVPFFLVACGDDPVPAPRNAAVFTNFQAASLVIGQPDFTTTTSHPANAGGGRFACAYGGAWTDASGKFWVSDSCNSRVLAFNTFPTVNGAVADFAVGQADLVTGTAGFAANQFDTPTHIQVVGTKLLVGEESNNRITIRNTLPTASGSSADVVVGAPDFSAAGPANCDQASLNYVDQFVVDPMGRLIVADEDNNRIMIWNTIPTTNGVNADIVIGQPDFTTCTSGTTATKFNTPVGVWSDGTYLVVGERNNNRVLIYHTFPTSSAAVPDQILGQADATSSTSGTTATTFSGPAHVTGFKTDAGLQLFVSDEGNARILIWNNVLNGGPADVVLGQGDFTHGTSNDDNQDNADDGTATNRTISSCWGLSFDEISKTLFMADENNNRTLFFQGQ